MKEESIYARGFLDWAYNTRIGKRATDIFFSRKWLSWCYGRLYKQSWSRLKIRPFVQKTDVRLDELDRPLDEFRSFSEFFSRDIDLSKRPISSDPDICLAACDGKVLAYSVVAPDMTFLIKGNTFNLRRFLANDALAARFAYGAMVISRLSMADYHHIHFPDSGTPRRSTSIPGKYHAGGSYSMKAALPYFAENHRMITLFDSDHFGPMMIAEVGALTVGSIRQCFQDGSYVKKGAHKGFFELGGSTVVLIFEPGRIELDQDLCGQTLLGIETYVRFGDSLGWRPRAFGCASRKGREVLS